VSYFRSHTTRFTSNVTFAFMFVLDLGFNFCHTFPGQLLPAVLCTVPKTKPKISRVVAHRGAAGAISPLCRALSTRADERGTAARMSVGTTVSLGLAPAAVPAAAPAAVPAQSSVGDWRDNLTGDEAWLLGPRSADWYTGEAPRPGTAVHSQAPPDLATVDRQGLLAYFKNAWAITETLFAGLQGEEPFYRPPYHDLRHPLIFYYGHVAALYVNKLRVAGLLGAGVDPYFEQIFETGVDEMRWDDLSKNHMQWPAVRDVHAYRAKVGAACMYA